MRKHILILALIAAAGSAQAAPPAQTRLDCRKVFEEFEQAQARYTQCTGEWSDLLDALATREEAVSSLMVQYLDRGCESGDEFMLPAQRRDCSRLAGRFVAAENAFKQAYDQAKAKENDCSAFLCQSGSTLYPGTTANCLAINAVEPGEGNAVQDFFGLGRRRAECMIDKKTFREKELAAYRCSGRACARFAKQ